MINNFKVLPVRLYRMNSTPQEYPSRGGTAMARGVSTAHSDTYVKRLDTALQVPHVRRFSAELTGKVIGQPEAVKSFVAAYQTFAAGLHPVNRPVSVLLLAGPSGVGKTRIVEASADLLLGSPQALTKINCAEYHLPHETAKLIGAPPGYIGHREGAPLLAQEAIDQYQTEKCALNFILFDEIEKANDTLWQLMLGILDKAQLTLGDNRKVDFSKCIIAMTSNLGAREMDNVISGNAIGFTQQAATDSRLSETVMTQIQRRFTPEFMNRVDKIVVFNRLDRQHLGKILQIELDAVQNRIFLASAAKGMPIFVLKWSASLKEFLLDTGTNAKYGARELKRTIERETVLPLANLVASKQISEGDNVVADIENGAVIFYKESVA